MKSKQRVVIINCFETLEHRAELLKRYFTEQGHPVLVLTSNWQHFHKSVRTECPDGYEMIPTRPYHRNLSAERMASHHYFAKDVIARVEQLQPWLLWVLVPPNTLAKCAARYKEMHPEVKLVFDIIDMWPETMPISKFKTLPPFTNWRNLRDDYLRYADAVVTECGLYQTVLRRKCAPEKMHTLYLARDLKRFSSCPNPPTDRTALCYLGSINNIIDIPCISKIIGAIDGDVDLHIIGDGEKRQELIDSATAAGANVVFHGKVYDPGEKQQIMDRCHAGLNIMKDSVFVGLTMKSMDYFECGIPIINNIKGDTWQFVEQYGIGQNIAPNRLCNREQIAALQNNRRQVYEFGCDKFDTSAFMQNLNKIVKTLL